MLSFFKNTSTALTSPKTFYAYPRASDLNDHELLESIRQVFHKNKPAISALFLIALENLPFRYANFRKAMLISNQYPASIDGFIESALDAHAKHQADTLEDEINSRRWFYFYVAALLTTAQDRARRKPELWDAIAEIWCQLMGDAHTLRGTIDQTVVWNPHEVITFNEIQSESDGEKFVASVLLPKEIRNHEKLKPWLQRDLQKELLDFFALDDLFVNNWA
jgi:hypothetical protein